MTTKRWAIAVVALCALGGRAAASPETVETVLGSDRFVAGGSVVFDEPVAGDLIAAGGDVESGAAVQGDALLAGGNLRLEGRVGQNVYAAGGKVIVNAAVARNVRIAGGQAEIGPKAVVDGNVTIAGGQVTIRGAVKGYVQAAGGRVFIDGPIDGDVVTTSGEIELGPAARIGGKLHYRSHDELRRDPGAEVAGGIEHIGSSTGGAPANTYSHYATWKTGWVWTAGLMILAALIAGALPAYSQRAGEPLRTHPWLASLFGFIAIVCVPVTVIVLVITIVGIPLALLVLLLYFALLLVGYITTALALGDTALARYRSRDVARAGWRVGAAVLAVLVLALFGRVPFIGGLVAFLAMVAGVGSVVMSFRPRKAG